MSIEAVPFDDDPKETDDKVVSATPLMSLRRKVEQAREQTWMEKSPLGLDGITLRFRPLDPDEFNEIQRHRGLIDRTGRPRDVLPFSQENMLAYCDMLARACIGIYVEVDGERCNALGLRDSVTFATPELAQDLGVEDGKAVDVVRALIPFKGEIFGLGDSLIRFSFHSAEGVQEAARGNF